MAALPIKLLELISLESMTLAGIVFVLAALIGIQSKRTRSLEALLVSLFVFGLGAGLASYSIFKYSPSAALIISGLSCLLLFAASLWILSKLRPPEAPACSGKGQMLAAFLLISAAGLPIRLWELPSLGRVHHCEQNVSAEMAMGVLERGVPLFVSSFDTDPKTFLQFLPSDNLFADPLALLTLAFGPSMLTLKMLALIFGICGILLLFWVGIRWLGFMPGLAGALLLALSPYMIGLSREVIYAYGLIVPYSLLTIHLLLKSLDRPTFLNFFGAAALAFGTFYIYFPALVLFPLVLGAWAAYYPTDRVFRERSGNALLYALIAALPILVPYFYMLYWDSRYHYLGNLARYMHDESRFHSPSLLFILKGAAAAYWPSRFFVGEPMNFLAGIGHIWGKTNGQHLPFEALSFFVGLAAAILRFRQSKAQQILVVLFVAASLPGFLSSPTERRYLVEQCAFYLIAGQGLAVILIYGGRLMPTFAARAAAGGLVFILGVLLNYGLFMDRALAVPRYFNREAAELIAARLNSGEQAGAIFAWEDEDVCVIPGLAAYLSWNESLGRRRQIAARLRPDFNELKTFDAGDWPPELNSVRIFMRRSLLRDGIAVQRVIDRFGKGPGDNLISGEEIFWIDVQRSEFAAARDFLCGNVLNCPNKPDKSSY